MPVNKKAKKNYRNCLLGKITINMLTVYVFLPFLPSAYDKVEKPTVF